MMQLSLFQQYKPPAPRYGGHENQPLQRFWLSKAVAAVQANPRCFQGEAACLQWGLSASRLRSLLFWALAFKVILPQGSPACYVVSAWGDQLFGQHGSDPYLEDPASLWLLHWQFLKPPCHAKVWSWFFHNPQHPTTKDGFIGALLQWNDNTDQVAESRVKGDLECLLKMYCPPKQSLEDSLLNLYSEVPLIRWDSNGCMHRLTGPRAGLSTVALLYCCLDYANEGAAIKVNRCAYGEGSPGVILGLSYQQLVEALGHATSFQAGVTCSNAMEGGYQLSWTQPTSIVKQQVWKSLYSGKLWTQKVWY